MHLHRRYIFSWKCICSIGYEQAGLLGGGAAASAQVPFNLTRSIPFRLAPSGIGTYADIADIAGVGGIYHLSNGSIASDDALRVGFMSVYALFFRLLLAIIKGDGEQSSRRGRHLPSMIEWPVAQPCRDVDNVKRAL